MGKPFFVNLFSIITSSSNRIEDYLTEILKLFLSESNNTQLFLTQLLDSTLNLNEDFECQTQVLYEALNIFNHKTGSRIDLLIKSKITNNYLIFIENKIEAEEGINELREKDQLKKYSEHLSITNYSNKYLLFFAKRMEDIKKSSINLDFIRKNNIIYKPFTWEDVYIKLKEVSKITGPSFALNELLRYLEYHKMELIMKLNIKDFDLLKKVHRIDLIKKSILKKISEIKLKDIGLHLDYDWQPYNAEGNAFWGKKISLIPSRENGIGLFVYFQLLENTSIQDEHISLILLLEYWGKNEEIQNFINNVMYNRLKEFSWRLDITGVADLILEKDISEIMRNDYSLDSIKDYIIKNLKDINSDLNKLLTKYSQIYEVPL